MKTAIVTITFWAAVAVWGFWGWACVCTVAGLILWYTTRKEG